MRVNTDKLLLYLIIVFPISTITGSIPIIGVIINKVLFGVIIALLLFGLIKAGLSRIEWIILMLLVITYTYDLFVTTWPLINSNEVFYLGTWVIFLMYVKKKYDYIKIQLLKCVQEIKWMVIIWEVIVGIGFVLPFCYEKYGAYSSFTGSAHRMDSSALIVLAAILFLFRYYNYKKRFWFLLIIPSIAIFLSGVRTYLVLLGLVLCAFYYFANRNNLKVFYITIIPIAIILVTLVMTSSVMQHRMDLIEQDQEYFKSQGYNALTGITSGRSTFWIIDLYHYWLSPFINKILGNGFNFVRYINGVFYTAQHWAHNDFINIICCNGITGLFLYFYSYISASHSVIKRFKQPVILIVGFHLICMFNAMFNMLYTYFAATLSIPFFLIAFFDKDIFGEGKRMVIIKNKTNYRND